VHTKSFDKIPFKSLALIACIECAPPARNSTELSLTTSAYVLPMICDLRGNSNLVDPFDVTS